MRERCAEIGRDPETIEKTASFDMILRDTREAALAGLRRDRDCRRVRGGPRRRAPRRHAGAGGGQPSADRGARVPAHPRRPPRTLRRRDDRPDRRGAGAAERVTRRVVALAGGVGGAKLAEGLAGARRRRPRRRRQHRRRLRPPRAARDARPRHRPVQPRRDRAGTRSAGASRATRSPRWTSWARTARRRGSGSATATSRCTSRARRGSGPAAGSTDVCLGLQAALGIAPRILPMTDATVATEVRTADGWLEFQEYFVHRRQEPDVLEVRFAGIEAAVPRPRSLAALERAEAIVLCPSNPLVSVGPILAVPGLRAALVAARARGVPVAAVSPIVGGKALKGPADRMLVALGHESSASGVARLYADLVDIFVLDASMRPRPARSRRSGSARSSPTRSWPTTSRGPGSRARSLAAVLGVRRTASSSPSRRSTTRSRGSARSSTPRSAATSSSACSAAPWPRRWRRPGSSRSLVVSPDPEVLGRRRGVGRPARRAAVAGPEPRAAGGARRRDRRRGSWSCPPTSPASPPPMSRVSSQPGDAAGSPSVVLAPDRHGRGTNALLLDPPDAIDPAFGGDSRAGHAWLAASADIPFVEVPRGPGPRRRHPRGPAARRGRSRPEALHAD